MSENLVFVSGASSGIGLAVAQTLPFDARVIDLSRRGGPGLEHVAVDLSEPAGWRAAADCFEREIPDFGGERVVFVHCAGTLEPIGFAGEVDPAAYTRNVLLNSASPQILGAAFLRAAARTRAACTLLILSSGAASNVYEGWSSYGAGKAAVDQWVRTVGREQERRGGCRVLAVAPGVIATPMQEQIRETAPKDFPDLDRFVALHEDGELRDPQDAARDLWALLGRSDLENGAVLDLRT